jgi:hypothetical protein
MSLLNCKARHPIHSHMRSAAARVYHAFLENCPSSPPTFSTHRYGLIAVGLFGVLCAFYGAWPIWRAFFPLEIDLKEPWNAYHSDAALGAGVLYPDLTGLVANNYPPLWYYLTGLLSRVGVDAIYVGRALSLLATLSLSVSIALCIRLFQAAWPAALLGGFCFFGIMVRSADWYVAMNDPHVPALFLMMLGLIWLLRRDQGRSPLPPILLILFAGFFKHALVAVPATALFLLVCRDRLLALRTTLTAAGVAAAVIAIFTFIYGMPFIDQVFFYPREILLERAWKSPERLGGIAPALIVCGVWAWYDRRTKAARFTASFVVFAFAAYVLQKAGAGVDINAQFELNVGVSIGIGLTFDRLSLVPAIGWSGPESLRVGLVGLLCTGLAVAPGLEPYFLFMSASYREQFWRNSDIMRSEINRIAAIPGPVRCSVETVCRAAGKPFVFDQFFIGQKGATKQLTAADLSARLRTVQYEEIDPRATVRPLQRQLFYGRSR